MDEKEVSVLRSRIHSLAAIVVISSGNQNLMLHTHESRRHLMRAKRWLGKVLEAKEVKSPYGSQYKTVTEIAPETDVPTLPVADTRTELERLQDYRKAAGMLLDLVKDVTGSSRLESVAWTQVYVSLTDARMCLGEALGALQDGE